LTLTELRGNPVVLNLWASWCLPCRSEMPAIEKAYHRYRDASLIVIGLDMTSQDSESDARAFVEELGLTFPIVLDRDGSVQSHYQLLGLPSTYFIDRQGIIRSAVIGGPMSKATIQSNIEDLLLEKIMFPFLRIGPFLIQTSGLALLAGLWVATTLTEKEALHLKLNATAILNMIFYGLIGGLLDARLIYAVQHLNIYLASPLSLFSLNTSTLTPLGGLISGLVIASLFGRRQKLPLRPTLDALVPGFVMMMIAIGIANFLNGNAYGSPWRPPWAIRLWDEYRHPTQIYETIAALIIFILWKMSSTTESGGSGMSFLYVVALSAGGRVFLEAFRGDSIRWLDGFRAAQVMGLIVITIAIYFTKQWGRPKQSKTCSKDSVFPVASSIPIWKGGESD